MLKVEAVTKVYYTCILSDEDENKVLDYIKENPKKFEFMSDKKKIIKAVEKLYEDAEVNLYEDSVESDFATKKIKWSEFEERTADEILIGEKHRD